MLENASLLEFYQDQPQLIARFPRTDAGELGWLPAVDVRETNDEVLIYAALPGVAKDDINIEVETGALTLSGRRSERSTEGWVRREIIAGPFNRRLPLPADVVASQATASHKDGVLEIRLPKERGGKPRTLKVQ